MLERVVPPLFFQRLLRRDADHDLRRVLIAYYDGVVVLHLIVDGIGAAVGGLCRHDDTLALLVVSEGDGGVGLQGHLLLERVFV